MELRSSLRLIREFAPPSRDAIGSGRVIKLSGRLQSPPPGRTVASPPPGTGCRSSAPTPALPWHADLQGDLRVDGCRAAEQSSEAGKGGESRAGKQRAASKQARAVATADDLRRRRSSQPTRQPASSWAGCVRSGIQNIPKSRTRFRRACGRPGQPGWGWPARCPGWG